MADDDARGGLKAGKEAEMKEERRRIDTSHMNLALARRWPSPRRTCSTMAEASVARDRDKPVRPTSAAFELVPWHHAAGFSTSGTTKHLVVNELEITMLRPARGDVPGTRVARYTTTLFCTLLARIALCLAVGILASDSSALFYGTRVGVNNAQW